MKKKKIQTIVKKNKKSTGKVTIKRGKALRGGLGAGTLYAIVGLLVISLGAVSMIGNVIPLSSKSPTSGQSVIISPPNSEAEKDNLQLFYFPGVTYTPTPVPTTPPGPGSSWGDNNQNQRQDGNRSSCFIAGTKILMADLSEKNIEEINPGDYIMSYDGNSLSKQQVSQIESPIRDHHYIIKFSDQTEIGITNEHPILTNKGWGAISPEDSKNESPDLEVVELEIGSKVLNSNGNFVKIISITYFPGEIQTYNLKNVGEFNNYFANGIVAHNKGNAAPNTGRGGSGGSRGGGGSGGTAM